MDRRLLAAGLAALSLIAPAAAQANENQLSIMQDDDALVYGGDAKRDATLARMKALGVDAVRVTVLWKTVAENARFSAADIKRLKLTGKVKTAAQKQTKKFKATNPSTYPIRNWDRYDNLVTAAKNVSIRIYFNITGPGPAWAMTKPPKRYNSLRESWKPRPAAFKQFAERKTGVKKLAFLLHPS